MRVIVPLTQTAAARILNPSPSLCLSTPDWLRLSLFQGLGLAVMQHSNDSDCAEWAEQPTTD